MTLINHSFWKTNSCKCHQLPAS